MRMTSAKQGTLGRRRTALQAKEDVERPPQGPWGTNSEGAEPQHTDAPRPTKGSNQPYPQGTRHPLTTAAQETNTHAQSQATFINQRGTRARMRPTAQLRVRVKEGGTGIPRAQPTSQQCHMDRPCAQEAVGHVNNMPDAAPKNLKPCRSKKMAPKEVEAHERPAGLRQ